MVLSVMVASEMEARGGQEEGWKCRVCGCVRCSSCCCVTGEERKAELAIEELMEWWSTAAAGEEAVVDGDWF